MDFLATYCCQSNKSQDTSSAPKGKLLGRWKAVLSGMQPEGKGKGGLVFTGFLSIFEAGLFRYTGHWGVAKW
jgi:hypothetical protein